VLLWQTILVKTTHTSLIRVFEGTFIPL